MDVDATRYALAVCGYGFYADEYDLCCKVDLRHVRVEFGILAIKAGPRVPEHGWDR